MTAAVLFLDIDGVLNAHDFCPLARSGPIHRDKMDRLNWVLSGSGAVVVLSSAWRYIVHRGEATVAGIDWLLRSHGLHAGRLVGITRPDTLVSRVVTWDGSTVWPQTDERGSQIRDWLAAHPQYRRYAAVDDLDLGITAAGVPLVKTDGAVGLTDADALALRALLWTEATDE